MDHSEVVAALRTLPLLPGLDLPAEFEGLDERLRAPSAGGVALLGLFNRGKSTLFNALLGAAVSPTSWSAETSAFISATTGLEHASAIRGGVSRQLPCEPSSFAKTLSREANAGWSSASISGPFRTPSGLRLVDTPGLFEPDAGYADSWKSHAISGALVVVSWPPGAAEQDLQLLEAANRTLAGNVAVVITQTTKSGSDLELAAIARKITDECGLIPIRVPSAMPSGPWGTDPGWSHVEEAIARVHAGGSTAQMEGLRRFEILVNESTKWIRSTTWGEAKRPDLTSAWSSARGAPVLHAALGRALEELDERQDATRREQAAAEAAAEKEAATAAKQGRKIEQAENAVTNARAALAKAHAWRPEGFWDHIDSAIGGGASDLFVQAGRAFRKVIPFSKAGVPPAVNAVQKLSRDQALCGRMDITIQELLTALPAGSAQMQCYRAASFSQQERIDLRNELPEAEMRWQVERDLLTAMDPHDVSLARRLSTSADVGIRNRAGAVIVRDIVNRFDALYQPVEDLQHWDQRRAALINESRPWLGNSATKTVAGLDRLQTHVTYAEQSGRGWAAQSSNVTGAAKQAHASALANWNIGRVVSYIGWAISVLILAADAAPGAAFLLWLGSFVLWLMARSRLADLNQDGAWSTFLDRSA